MNMPIQLPFSGTPCKSDFQIFFMISGPYFMIKIKHARTEHEPNLQILLHYKQEAQLK